MKKYLSLILCLLLLCSSAAVAFADETTEVSVVDESYYTKLRGQDISLSVYNWGEYISDGSDGTLNVNKAFEELTGIKVLYTTFATNEELYAKLKSGGASYDVVIPSDYMVARMIAEGLIQPLNYDNIPNIRFIDEQYRYTDFDPNGEYTAAYTWGTVGITGRYTSLANAEADTKSWTSCGMNGIWARS